MRKGTRPVLLVVDDDASILSTLDRSLRRAKYEVHLAEGGTAALEVLDRIRPDLVLLDVLMPGGPDGYQVCRELRARPDMDLVPVVFVTALDTEQDEAKAFSASGSAFLRKPFELEELLALVEDHLETSKKWSSANFSAPKREEHWTDWLAPEKFAEFKQFLMDERKSGAAREDEIKKVPPQRLYDLAPLLNLPEEQVARFVSNFLNLPYVNRVNSDEIRLGVLPRAFSEKNSVVPVRRPDDKVGVVLSNPFNWELLESLNHTMWRGDTPDVSITSPDVIDQLFEDSEDELLRVPTFEELTKALDDETDEDNHNPVTQLANELLRAAMAERASDIHIEPKDRHTLVRFRIDGDMQDIRTMDRVYASRLVSRFKALAAMDIAERRKPQDGSVEVLIEGARLKLRLATSSTSDGESLVIRLLEPTKSAARLEHLGMAIAQVELLTTMANRHQGMILLVGPTGSGKSTTIFSLLCRIDGDTRSIISVEDPVEYRIPFANQQEVNEKAGITFETLLRSVMRQDPDILFLGEIRDNFSAKAALDFASSGHLTISTLHSANSTSAIFRLERLGIDPASLADSLLGIVAQKLAKKLCPHCREVRAISAVERDLLSGFTDNVPESVGQPKGCPACRDTGYLGREAVNEILQFDPALAELVRSGGSINQLRQFAVDRGDFMIYDHALEKVRQLIFAPRDAYEMVLMEEMRFRQAMDAQTSMGLSGSDGSQTEIGAATEEPTAAASSPPADTPAPPEASPARAAATSAIPRPQNPTDEVLVVEDDKVTLLMVESILMRAGYAVTTATDGAAALLAFGQGNFDIVLSDLNMPNLGGMKLLELLISSGSEVPLIFLTSEKDSDVEGAALAAGAIDFIRKPVNPEVLLTRVRNGISRVRAVIA